MPRKEKITTIKEIIDNNIDYPDHDTFEINYDAIAKEICKKIEKMIHKYHYDYQIMISDWQQFKIDNGVKK